MINRPRMLTWILLAVASWGWLTRGIFAEENSVPPSLATWERRLAGEDLQVRRRAATDTRAADRSLQIQLLPALIERLMEEKDGQVRLAVFDTITEMGAAAEPAVDALVHTLRTDYGGRRNEELHQDYRAAFALARIGQPAIDGLRGLLTEEAENVRAEAAMALGRIGPPAQVAASDLVALLDDEKPRVRNEASIALGEIGEGAVEPLLDATETGSAVVQAGALRALGLSAPTNVHAIEAIRQGARHHEPQVRAAAIQSLANVRMPNEELRQILVENVRHQDAMVRFAAVDVLTEQPTLLKQIESELSNLLTDDDHDVARHAAFLLQRIGPDALATLIGALREPNSRVEQIGGALASIGRPAVGRLTEAWTDPNPRVRQGAATALGKIRPLSEETVRLLIDGLNDPDRQVQAACLASIGSLGPRAHQAVPAVREKLKDPSPIIRELAIDILFAALPRDEPLVDELTAMIDDPEARVQQKAIDTIRAAGPSSRRALPSVINALESPHPQVRVVAAQLIGSHGQAAAQAVPVLMGLLENADGESRLVVIRTLGQIGPSAEPAFNQLTSFLDDADAEVRAAAVQTVGRLELSIAQLRPHFSKALRDPESDVRRQAFRGIRRLGEQANVFIPDLILLVTDEQAGRFVKRILERYEQYGVDEQSIPELVELLNHESDDVKQLAIRFLGLAGPMAIEALPILQRLASDSRDELRAAATTSMAAITESDTDSRGSGNVGDD